MSGQPIHLVLIVAFEPDGGSIPGELTLWRERLGLTESLPFPAGYRPLWTDGQGVLAMVCGVGAARAAASMMALGLDPRFDLTRAFFLITGVAGITPEQGSLASVVLPTWVVDGSLTHELDAREIPHKWSDGFVPIGKTMPYERPREPRFNGDDGIVFRLHEPLVVWAHELIRGIELRDTPEMEARRAQFLPPQGPPQVLYGDELSSSTFFHGRLLSERATCWVDYQTEAKGRYTITAMEDAGLLQSLTFLSAAGQVEFNRVLILRAASNYDRQREGISAAESLAETRVATYSAYRPALENLVRTGVPLIQALLAAWPARPDAL